MMPLAALVSPEELDGLWPEVEPLIELGLRNINQTWASDDLRDFIRRGQKQLWLSVPDAECAMVTQIDQWPRGKVLHIFMVAGKLPDRWADILAAVESWGKERGCRKVELRGRLGWTRKLKGYSAPRVFMEKDLCDA